MYILTVQLRYEELEFRCDIFKFIFDIYCAINAWLAIIVLIPSLVGYEV